MAIIRSGVPGEPEWEVRFGNAEMDNRVLGPEDLAQIRAQVESLDDIEAISPAVRAIVMRYWPGLANKWPPPEQLTSPAAHQYEEFRVTVRPAQLDPGSPEAIVRGCTCDPKKNANGHGRMLPDGRGPVYNPGPDCPMHGLEALAELLNDDDGEDDPQPH